MSATTWGDPNATKRVLLIHGITGSSHLWHPIASQLASRGYFVTAPDLHGHGNAGRGGPDYTVAALADRVAPYITAAPHQIVIGHSLGGIVASVLLSRLKSAHPVRVVLVDPPLELDTESLISVGSHVLESVANSKTVEEYQQELQLPIELAIYVWLSKRLCDPASVEAIIKQNDPWSFSHNLSTVPDNVKVTVLAADPAKGAMVKEEDIKGYPHVTVKTVWGASHSIPRDAPEAIFEAAIGGNESHT